MMKSFKSLVFKSLSDLRFKMFKKWKEKLFFFSFFLFLKKWKLYFEENAFFVILKSREKLQNE